MSYKIVFHKIALLEFKDSYDWYFKRSENAANNFSLEFEKSLNELKKFPTNYKTCYKKLREKKLKVFPFSIIYEIIDTDKSIYIHSLFHLKRNPKARYINRIIE